MTLKEKFYPYSDNEYSEKWINAENCEDVADDYAIEFVGWMYINCSFNNYPLYKMYEEGEEQFTSKEVLEIFKKEKGYV